MGVTPLIGNERNLEDDGDPPKVSSVMIALAVPQFTNPERK
jgi:hypothetical protein